MTFIHALPIAFLAVIAGLTIVAAISLAADAIEHAADKCAGWIVPDVKLGRLHD